MGIFQIFQKPKRTRTTIEVKLNERDGTVGRLRKEQLSKEGRRFLEHMNFALLGSGYAVKSVTEDIDPKKTYGIGLNEKHWPAYLHVEVYKLEKPRKIDSYGSVEIAEDKEGNLAVYLENVRESRLRSCESLIKNYDLSRMKGYVKEEKKEEEKP